MLPLELAAAHRLRQQGVSAQTLDRIRRLWRLLDPGDPRGSWAALEPRALDALTAGQAEAARGADDYVSASLAEQGATPDPVGRVPARAFAGTAADGRALDTLLAQPVYSATALVERGLDGASALAMAGRQMDRIIVTEVADAARTATGVAIVNDRRAHGWVRMVTPPSCSRCIVLAGKHYAYRDGFQRHPHCDCVHVPAAEAMHPQSPRALFGAMTAAQQDNAFTKAGAQAIRDGADIAQVVNARRGAFGLVPAGARLTAAEEQTMRGGRARGHLETRRVFGQDLYLTSEGTTARGLAGVRLGAKQNGVKQAGIRSRVARAPRLMPESIYAEANRLGWTRDETIRQLTRNGYILDGSAAPRTAAPRLAAPRPAPPATEHAALDAVPAGLGRATSGAPTLTRQHRDALRDYQSSFYYAINGQLRRGQVDDAFVARRVERLDEVMRMSRLTSDVEVWRGVTDAERMFGGALGRDMVGMEWRESAYVSTSAKRTEAGQFVYAGTPGAKVLMRIVAPRGMGAARLSGMDDQAEILLQRGTRMRVVADHGVTPEGYRRIDVAAMP